MLLFFDGVLASVFINTGILHVFVSSGAESDTADLVGVVDRRWGLIYFLPRQLFVTPNIAAKAVLQHFEEGGISLLKVLQDSDACKEVYDEMVANGEFDEKEWL